MLFGITITAVILGFAAVLLYFFCLTFVKKRPQNLEDLAHKENRLIAGYGDIVKQGMEYIHNTTHEWVSIVSFDALKLYARYYDIGSNKTMMLFHGYRSSGVRDFSCAVKFYIENGYNILLVDQRACGKSDGKLITYGIKESRDVLSWVEYLNSYKPVANIALGGMSMGATTVLLASALNLPQNVKCIVADCGFSSPEEIIKVVAKRFYGINAEFFIPMLDICCKIFGKFSIKGVSTQNALKNASLPILFIHGKADGFVPCYMSQAGYTAAADRSEIILVEGANHGMSFLLEPENVKLKLTDFLNRYMH